MNKNTKKTGRPLLSEGEHMLFHTRGHWVVFIAPAIYALIALAAGIFFHPLMGALILFLDLYPIYKATVFYITMHLVLSDRKVIGRSGFLTRDIRQLTLTRIETAYLEEPVLGRVLGYATVIINGTGTGIISFPYVVNGGAFIEKLEAQLAKIEKHESGDDQATKA